MLYNSDDFMFNILTIDRFFHKKGVFDVKARPYAALSFRERGTGTFKIGGRIFHTKPGDVLFIPANVPYEVEYSASESIVVHLLDCNYGTAEKISASDREQLEKRFLRMLNVWQTHHSVNRTKSNIYDVLSYLESDIVALPPESDILECVRYIDEHYTETDVTIERLCTQYHISHSSLQRKFRKYFGMNPKEYITKLRMNRALDMLTAGGESIKAISYACGFEDEKYFSRAVKAHFGKSPSQIAKTSYV